MYIHKCVLACMHVSMFFRLYAHEYVYACILICMFMFMYVYIRVYLCVCVLYGYACMQVIYKFTGVYI